MFKDIQYDKSSNATWFMTPEHMADEYYDIIDRVFGWDENINCPYGYMFEGDDCPIY